MKVRKVIAGSMKEAMKRVRDEMGPDAVILQTRTLPKSFLGIFARNRVEITAASEVPDPGSKAPPNPLLRKNDFSGHKGQNKTESEPASSGLPYADSLAPAASLSRQTTVQLSDSSLATSRLISLEDKIAKLTSTVEALLTKSFTPNRFQGKWEEVQQRLLKMGLEESLAQGVIEDLGRDEVPPEKYLAEDQFFITYLSKGIPAEGGVRRPQEGQKVIVLIGPTGVGKTTTLAKISAEFLRQGCRIAFITADTYRLAAVEQLQKYADIMALSLETVYSPEEMEKAIGRHSDKELIFVDTAGRSQRNSAQMEELKTFVSACQPAEVHLLLSATTKREDLEEILERFSICPIDRLVLTKADESKCFGPFYSIVKRHGIPFSYVTTGQNVPEDIEEATPEKVAGLICRGTLEPVLQSSVDREMVTPTMGF